MVPAQEEIPVQDQALMIQIHNRLLKFLFEWLLLVEFVMHIPRCV